MSVVHRPKAFATTRKIRRAVYLGALCGFIACSTLSLGVPLFDLKSAGPTNWTVLEVGNGTVTESVDLSNPQGAVFGNVGIQEKGKLQSSGPVIHGDLYLGNNSSASFSGSSTVTGTVHLAPGAKVTPTTLTKVNDPTTQPKLDQAETDAIAGSAAAAALTPTSTLKAINLSHTTMTLMAGVYNLKDFILDHATLTLSGPGYFVFNISNQNNPLTKNGTFKLSSGKVLLTKGAMGTHVLFNYLGTKDVAFSGGTGGTVPGGPDESVLHGIIVALNVNVNLAPGLVVGEIISGKNISIVSGAIVRQPPPTVPEGGSPLVLALISVGGFVAFRSLALRNLSFRLGRLR
jgi:Ice-binding-like